MTTAPTTSRGDFDWSDQPSASEIASAAQWKLTGYTDVGTDRASIEAALAQGTPVVISIPVYRDFYAVRSGNGGAYPYEQDRGPFQGWHAVTVLGYDQNGMRIENSWGTRCATGYAYQRQTCDGAGRSCSSNGGDSASYVLPRSSVGHRIRVVVTATSAGGSMAAGSATTSAVQAAYATPNLQGGPSPPRRPCSRGRI